MTRLLHIAICAAGASCAVAAASDQFTLLGSEVTATAYAWGQEVNQPYYTNWPTTFIANGSPQAPYYWAWGGRSSDDGVTWVGFPDHKTTLNTSSIRLDFLPGWSYPFTLPAYPYSYGGLASPYAEVAPGVQIRSGAVYSLSGAPRLGTIAINPETNVSVVRVDPQSGAIIESRPFRASDISYNGRAIAVDLNNVAYSSNSKILLDVTFRPATFVLAIGLKETVVDPDTGQSSTLQANLDAISFSAAVRAAVPDATIRTIELDANAGVYLSRAQLRNELAQIRSKLQPGDQVLLYLGSHGYNAGQIPGSGYEKPHFGNEYLAISGSDPYGNLADNDLTELLNEFDPQGIFRKLTFIDACRSGGFWGNFDSTENDALGDLNLVKNISLMTSASETKNAYYSQAGRLYWTRALADAIREGGLTTFKPKDLAAYVNQKEVEYARADGQYFEAGFGELVGFDSNHFDPVFFASSDFSDGPILFVPELRPFWLLLLGLPIVVLHIRSRKQEA